MTTMSREERIELQKDFKYNDRDGDGRINFLEFLALLEDLDSGVEGEEAQIGFREIDVNHDGAIEFDEFVTWWTSH